MALFYTDTSALVKLLREEPESPALRTLLAEADLLCSELVLAEPPRGSPRGGRRPTAATRGPAGARR